MTEAAQDTAPPLKLPLIAGLSVVTVIGGWLRLNGLGEKCLWCDEALSWRLASFSVSEIVQKCLEQSSTHPPLYFLMLRGWMALVGDSAFALRLLAALCGIAAIPLSFFLARSAFGLLRSSLPARAKHAGALCFASLIAANPMQISHPDRYADTRLAYCSGSLGAWPC